MPIAETTVVQTIKKGRKAPSKQPERRVQEKVQDDTELRQDMTATLFDIKESKYHEDLFARE